MPTNLPPEYFEAERRYREATSVEEKIETLEALIGTVPKHKGTDHLRADMRRRLSKLKDAAQTRKKSGKQESPYSIDKEGAGQIIVLGATNVGKSSLVVRLTNATPEVSAVPFTTWTPTPGMMPVDNIQIQLIDTPPLNRDYFEPELVNLLRRVDLILLVIDLQTDPVQQLEDGIEVLLKHRIVPEHIQHRFESDQRNIYVKPLVVLVNKYDDEGSAEVFDIFCELVDEEWPCVAVSALSGRNLEHLKQVLFERLDIIRVYAKPPGKEPDHTMPFVLKKGETIADFARQVHKDFYDHLKAARVWGTGVYDGQLVGRDHILSDGDVIELRI